MLYKKRSWGSLQKAVVVGVFGLVAAAASVAAPQSEPERQLTGTWYGEFSAGPGTPVQRFINARSADGSYILHSRMYEKGKMVAQLVNKGLWGISNGLYFTVTTEINGKPTDFKNAEVTNPYLVRNLTADAFEYQHIPSGNSFRVVRVDPATAKLPD